MITQNNLKDVLTALGFEKEPISNYYTHSYSTCAVSVDFDKQNLNYPEKEGLKVNDTTTSNFSHNENFVVFECVCRLLEKGYRPEHIELEPKWTLGHDAKSGKADILVRDEKGQTLIIIECKTAGAEYNKEKKNTEEDGGQLFSYWQQEGSARWLALYASDWKDGNLEYKSHVIHAEDDANIVAMAKKDKDVPIYANAHKDKERFAVWDETYNKEWLDNVIFDEESQAYKIGVPPLRKNKLRDFTPEDKIVNRFEEILRHNNVSDKENAFNRLVALFICKLVDEIKKQDFEEVEFQYKQGTDTYESLQDRLQRLHQQGMDEFMREKIFYIADDYAENLFQQYTGRQRKAAIEDLKKTIRILKFYSNNDFAFKDVHNEELFYQNGKILVEVVQLFQPYRIVYPSKHQFLGDLFEQLLNKGFKQNEGQFFTPTPITRFIWDSLPLQTYISEHGLPRIIDYACGAGHFLTEAIEAVNFVAKTTDNSWVERNVYGVEKDYRLARVSKVSMFMNGAGGANIIFGDGLENYPEKNLNAGEFDILVANPPYSVSGFKRHLKLRNNSFAILDSVTNDGKEIETLFVERIAQLLRPNGIAAVVLPASILSNSSGSYMAAREQLLQNFNIRAIVSFGSKTFGATGTNTVTLFLERYNEPPKISELTHDSIDAIMKGEELEEYTDKQLLDDYLAHQNITIEDYAEFISRNMSSQKISNNDYFRVYSDAFRHISVPIPKKTTEEEERLIRTEKFYNFALRLERKKLYYFSLARKQQVFVVTAPSDNKEQETFLGYKWSNRKGNEGIIINTLGGKLYNDKDRFARSTIAAAIRNSFVGASTQLTEDLQKYTNIYRLKDMMDFSRSDFDIGIATSIVKSIVFNSKFPLKKLSELLFINEVDKNPTKDPDKEFVYIDIASIENGTGKISQDNIIKGREAPSRARRYAFAGSTIISTVRPNLKAFAFVEKEIPQAVYSTGLAILRPRDENILMNKFLYILFMNMDELMAQIIERMPKGQYPSINKTDIESLQIPLPPLSIQQQIVKECETIDEEYNNSRMTTETYRQKIADIFDKLEVVSKSKQGGVNLDNVCQYISIRVPATNVPLADYISTDNMLQNCDGVTEYDGVPNIASLIEFKKDDILLSNIRPYLKKIWLADRDGGCNPDVLVLRVTDDAYLPSFVYNYLARQSFFDYVMENVKGMKMPRGNKNHILRYQLPQVSIEQQRNIVEEISEYQKKIVDASAVMMSCKQRKKDILQGYLA